MGSRHLRVAGVMGTIAVTLGLWGGALLLSAPPAAQSRQAPPEAARIRLTPARVAALGRFPREETFVLDVYARLMRYDFAAREFHRIQQGAEFRPADFLVARVRDLRTEPWTGQADPIRGAERGPVLEVQRQALCKGDDPCHTYYDVAWGSANHVGPSMSVRGTPARYTRYSVTLSLGPVTRTYEAVVVYQAEADGVTARPEIMDPVIPMLNEVAGDRAPLAKAPWDSYTKTRRYAATVQKARAWHARASQLAADVPIGFIVGDDLTEQDEMVVPMSGGEPCGGAPPALSGPDSVVRGQNAEFTVNAQTGAVISNWQFVAGDGLGTISRTTEIGDHRWSGPLVASGQVKVRVVVAGQTYDLAKAVTVTARAGWMTAAFSSDRKSEGDTSPEGQTFAFADPPQANQLLGRVLYNIGRYSYNDAAVPSGPNQGLRYVTSFTSTGSRYFQWAMTHHLADTGTEFYRMNCGRNGFISGAVLKSNVEEHEGGTILGHYQQYRDANNAQSTNVGAEAERHVKALSQVDFREDLQRALDAKLLQIHNAAGSESACNSLVTLDTSCTPRGAVNYPPYQPCSDPGEPHAVSFVSQSVPNSMNAGQSYAVSVTMRNTGTATWTAADGYKLGSQSPQDNQTWGTSRVLVPFNVAPDQQVTFNFTVTAPSTAGTYSFQWRMVKESVAWFGEFSPNVAVTVVGNGGQSPMQSDSAIRGCSDWWWWNPVYKPSASACYDYCAQNNAEACEWFVNGDCYVEFGSGCYVQGGFSGWSAAVLSGNAPEVQASVRPVPKEAATSKVVRAGRR